MYFVIILLTPNKTDHFRSKNVSRIRTNSFHCISLTKTKRKQYNKLTVLKINLNENFCNQKMRYYVRYYYKGPVLIIKKIPKKKASVRLQSYIY